MRTHPSQNKSVQLVSHIKIDELLKDYIETSQLNQKNLLDRWRIYIRNMSLTVVTIAWFIIAKQSIENQKNKHRIL